MRTLAPALLLGGLLAASTPAPASTLNLGLLTVTASPVNLANPVVPGTTLNVNLGPALVTDTLGDSTTWTLTAAASDCRSPNLSGLNLSVTNVPAADLSLTPGTPSVTVAQNPLHQIAPTAGPGGRFGFSTTYPDTSPGTSTGTPLLIASDLWASGDGVYDNDGQFSQVNTLQIATPTTMIAGTYTCTLQYSLTG